MGVRGWRILRISRRFYEGVMDIYGNSLRSIRITGSDRMKEKGFNIGGLLFQNLNVSVSPDMVLP